MCEMASMALRPSRLEMVGTAVARRIWDGKRRSTQSGGSWKTALVVLYCVVSPRQSDTNGVGGFGCRRPQLTVIGVRVSNTKSLSGRK